MPRNSAAACIGSNTAVPIRRVRPSFKGKEVGYWLYLGRCETCDRILQVSVWRPSNNLPRHMAGVKSQGTWSDREMLRMYEAGESTNLVEKMADEFPVYHCTLPDGRGFYAAIEAPADRAETLLPGLLTRLDIDLEGLKIKRVQNIGSAAEVTFWKDAALGYKATGSRDMFKLVGRVREFDDRMTAERTTKRRTEPV